MAIGYINSVVVDDTTPTTCGVGSGDDGDLFRGKVNAFAPSIIVVDGSRFRRVDLYTIYVGVEWVAVFALFFGIGRIGAFAQFDI